MGSGCSKKPKRQENDFFDQYAKYSNGPASMQEKTEEEVVQSAPNGLKSQLSNSSTLIEQERERLRRIRFSQDRPRTVKKSVDWDGLEKSIQAMNLKILREDLHGNPNQFLVNQILMSVQFFKNYDREKESFAQEKKDLDASFNDVLRDCKRHAYATDLIFQKVQEHVGVKAADQEAVLEPLLPTIHYISYQSVEANRPEDFQSLKYGSLDYSQVDEPTYRVCIEETKNFGYAKLHCIDDYSRSGSISEIKTPITPLSPPSKVGDEPESPGFQFLKDLSDHIQKTTGVAPSLEIKPQQPPQSDNQSSDEYGYGPVKNIALEDLIHSLEKSNLAKLPRKCFKTLKVPVLKEDEEIDPNDPYPLVSDLEEEKTFLLSKYFMQHFSATFYEMTRELNMNDLGTAAQVDGVRIKCRTEKYDSEVAKENWKDFIPCVDVPFWPDSGIEWYLRDRKKFQHKPTGTVYQWPPKELITVGADEHGNPVGPQWIGSSLVPCGLVAKEKKNGAKEWMIEWQWEFVRMEHFLLKSLNHPQMRFFLFVMLMFRTHLKEATSLDSSFLRHHFYSLLEKDPASWQDENLGDKFVLFFKSFLAKIEKKEQHNYFIKKENLLRKLPTHKIAEAHARLFRINENIVPHLLQAVKSLQYDRGFFPTLDCDYLIKILTTDVALKLVLPPLLTTFRQDSYESKKSQQSKKSQAKSKDKFQRMQELRLQKAKMMQQNGSAAPKAGRAKDLDLVDLNMQIPQKFSEARKKAILAFFISHYINLAKKSNEFRSYGQSLMLVLQAQNLVKLLEELGYGETKECHDFRIHLEKLRSICRVGAEGYWKVNWGCESNETALNRIDSFVSPKQHLPLPKLPPRSPSPIPGTESPPSNHNRDVIFVEVHEMNDESTEL